MLNETISEQVGQVVAEQIDSIEQMQVQITTQEEKSAPTQLDNILTLGMVALLGILVVVAVICKAASKKKAVAAPVAAEEAPAPVEAPVAPGVAGQLKLHDVEPKTAAMLMAIVADKMGKPINELRFISIKEVK